MKSVYNPLLPNDGHYMVPNEEGKKYNFIEEERTDGKI